MLGGLRRSGTTSVVSLGDSFTDYLVDTVNLGCSLEAAPSPMPSSSIAASSSPPGGPLDQWCAVEGCPRALPFPMASFACAMPSMGTHPVHADEPAQMSTCTGRKFAASPDSPHGPLWNLSACPLQARLPCSGRGSLHTHSTNKDTA